MNTLNAIAQAIYDKKGFNILSLDVRGVSTITDYVVIAEGTIDRHLKALLANVRNALVEQGQKPLYVEGEQSGDWIVIDYGDVVVHLLLPEYREKYGLEELWQQAKIVDLQIDTSKKVTARNDIFEIED